MPFAATRMDLEIIILSEVSQREIQNLKNDTGKIKNDTGDPGSIPGLERSSGKGKGNPLQYSCLENSMDRGAW